jgi:pilus assembly protein Flp/PilA
VIAVVQFGTGFATLFPFHVSAASTGSLVNRQDRFMSRLIKTFIADETGATAIEYGLIAAGISLAIIASVNGLGTKLNTRFTSINSALK